MFLPAITHAKRRAYAFYAANDEYMCSALVNIYRLQILNTPTEIIYTIIIPDNYKPNPRYQMAADRLGARLTLVPPLLGPTLNGYYRDCMAKLYVFNLTDYDRIVYLDSDSLILRPLHILFDLPDAAWLAAPRAYWLDPGKLREGCGSVSWNKADGPQVGLQMKFTSALLVVSPSTHVWKRIIDTYFPDGKPQLQMGHFDMDILNILFKDEVTLLRGESLLALTIHWANRMRDELPSLFNGNLTQDDVWKLTRVVHFSPTKPWMVRNVRMTKPNAHPHYYEAFETWHKVRDTVCN